MSAEGRRLHLILFSIFLNICLENHPERNHIADEPMEAELNDEPTAAAAAVLEGLNAIVNDADFINKNDTNKEFLNDFYCDENVHFFDDNVHVNSNNNNEESYDNLNNSNSIEASYIIDEDDDEYDLNVPFKAVQPIVKSSALVGPLPTINTLQLKVRCFIFLYFYNMVLRRSQPY